MSFIDPEVHIENILGGSRELYHLKFEETGVRTTAFRDALVK